MNQKIQLQHLLQNQYSPTTDTIQFYNPDGFHHQNLISIAEKARVLRYRNQIFILDEETIHESILQIQQNMRLFIHFLRRLISPIYDHEFVQFPQLDHIIISISFSTELLQEFGQWESIISQYEPKLLELIQSQNFSQFKDQLVLLQILVRKLKIDSSKQSDIIVVNPDLSWIYNSQYHIQSKKKSINSNKKNSFISEEEQHSFLQSTQNFQHFTEIFQLFTSYFNLQIEEVCLQEGQKWIVKLQYKHIIVTKSTLSKSTSKIEAKINILKVLGFNDLNNLAPIVFDRILKNYNVSFKQLVATNGRLTEQKQKSEIYIEEEYLLLVPIDYQLIDQYIEKFDNKQWKGIRKYQNTLIQHLSTKFRNLQIQQKIASIGPTFELDLTIKNTNYKQIFKTSLMTYGLGKLQAQAYVIEQIMAHLDFKGCRTIKELLKQIKQ